MSTRPCLALTSALTPPAPLHHSVPPPSAVNSSAAARGSETPEILSLSHPKSDEGQVRGTDAGVVGGASRQARWEVPSCLQAFACSLPSVWNAFPAPSKTCLQRHPSLSPAQTTPGLGVSVS